MLYTDPQVSLTLAEESLDALSQALLAGQPQGVESAARELQQAASALSGVLQNLRGKTTVDQRVRQRLGNLVQGIAMHREACARRAAVVERSLHSIIPATRSSTYTNTLGPYARNGRQSGVFRAS